MLEQRRQRSEAGLLHSDKALHDAANLQLAFDNLEKSRQSQRGLALAASHVDGLRRQSAQAHHALKLQPGLEQLAQAEAALFASADEVASAQAAVVKMDLARDLAVSAFTREQARQEGKQTKGPAGYQEVGCATCGAEFDCGSVGGILITGRWG